MYRGGVGTVGKEHFTFLYGPARVRALTRRNIAAGWAATGLFPFNSDRVLRDTPKPPAERAVLEESSPQLQTLVTPATPVTPKTPTTPATPATTEALASLHTLIKQDAHTLDEMSKQRL